MAVKTWFRATVMAGIASCLIGTSGVRPVVSASSMDGCPEAILATFTQDPWTPCRIAYCEVGGKIDPETGTFDNHLVGRAGEVSWAQIHPVHFSQYSRQRLIDDEWYVAQVMYELSSGGRNWRPWSCA